MAQEHDPLRIWEVLGTWAAAVGTIAAVVVSLWLARRQARPELSVFADKQIVMYWLLSYAASVERGAPEWSEGILVNPRLNLIVKLTYNEIIRVISAGRSKVELLELFAAMIGDRTFHMITSIR